MSRDYIKRLDKPKYKLPGIYPSGSIIELGFNRSDLENTSMGSFRIEKTKHWGYYFGLGEYTTDNVYASIQGFPALLDGLLLDWGRMAQNHTILSIPDIATNSVNGLGSAQTSMTGLAGLLEDLDEGFTAGFLSPKLKFSYDEDPDAYLNASGFQRSKHNNFTEIFKSNWVDIRVMVDDREDGEYDRDTGVQILGDVILNEDSGSSQFGEPIRNIKMELTVLQSRVLYDWFNRARLFHSPFQGATGQFDYTEVAFQLVREQKRNTHAIFGMGEWVYSPNLNLNYSYTPNNILGKFMGSYPNAEKFEEGHTNAYFDDYGPLSYEHYNAGILDGTGLYDEAAGANSGPEGVHKIRNYNRFRHRTTRGLTDGAINHSDWCWFPGLEFELKLQDTFDVISTGVGVPPNKTMIYSNACIAEYLKQAMELGTVNISENSGKIVAQNTDFWTTVLDIDNSLTDDFRGIWYIMYHRMGGLTNCWEGETIPSLTEQEGLWEEIAASNELPLWDEGDQIGFDIENYTAPQNPTIFYETGSFIQYLTTTSDSSYPPFLPTDAAPAWYQDHPYFTDGGIPPPRWGNVAVNQESNPTTWIKAIWLADGTRITAENHEEILYGFPDYYQATQFCILFDFHGSDNVWSDGTAYPGHAYSDEGLSDPYGTPQGDARKMYGTFDETQDQLKHPVAIELAYDDQYLLQQQLDDTWEGNPGEGAFEYRSIENYIRYMTMSIMENIIYNQDSHLLGKYAFFNNIAFDLQLIYPPPIVIEHGGENRELIHYLQMLSSADFTGAFLNTNLPADETELDQYLSGLTNWVQETGFANGLVPDENSTIPSDIFEQQNSPGVLKAITIGMPSFLFHPQGYYNQFLGFLDYATYTTDFSVLTVISEQFKVFYNLTFDKIPYETYIEVNVLDHTAESADELEPTLYYVPDSTADTDIPTAYYTVSSPLEVEFAIKPYNFDPYYMQLEKTSDGLIVANQISEMLTTWLNQITQYVDVWDADAAPNSQALYPWLSAPNLTSSNEWPYGEATHLYIEPSESFFMYRIVQWGDEKNLLSDDDIRNSKYFAPYQVDINDLEPLPINPEDDINFLTADDDNIFMKHLLTATPIVDVEGNTVKNRHVYMRPGVYKIKAIVYRLTPDRNIVIDTNLINKNIVVFDNTYPSEDFQQFGGTPFNFLPIKEGEGKLRQVMIGGMSNKSKYFDSISKLKISDNFRSEDFNEEFLVDNNLLKINSKLLGEHPGQLDLSTTRFFVNRTGPKNIYDFITGGTNEERNAIIAYLPYTGHNITNISGSALDSAFQLDTFATRIFIDDSESCDIEINPSESDFFIYHNTTGKETKGISIGDYKIKQNKDGKITSEPMETPFFENDSDKQAF